VTYTKEQQQVTITLPSHLSFFSDVLISTSKAWHTAVYKVYGSQVSINTLFKDTSTSPINDKEPDIPVAVLPEKKTSRIIVQQSNHKAKRLFSTAREKSIDVSDKAKWPKVNLILEYFPGVVTLADKEVQQ
jgi:hypothetical protein